MAGNTTKPYRNTLSGSVGAGMGSLFSPGGRKYYILEHKVSSKYHRAGEAQEIIVDNIELGRDARCQVRFDESFKTVSRHHAGIVRDGDIWKLVQISSTNSTLLNGRHVTTEWYLQNGDEIQLSVNGPKLGFIIPTGKKATVGSIALTRRLSLFRQQALRPYKTAIAVMGCLIVLLSCAGGYKMYDLHERNSHLEAAAASQQKELEAVNERNEALAREVASKGEVIAEMDKEIEALKKRPPKVIKQVVTPTPSPVVDNDAINKCLADVFFIKAQDFEITFPDGSNMKLECGDGEDQAYGWSGTGFLLSDGRFVTARHVTEPWFFFANGGGVNKKLFTYNAIANNGGKVVARLLAVSSSGKKFTFTSDQCRCDRSHDNEIHTDDGVRIMVGAIDNTDYSYFSHGGSGLPFNASKSSSLERGLKLTVLGFPLGLGANSVSDINPILGSAIVAANGLQDGVILTTDTNYESGNSGGPVFRTNESGDLEVVGIVSAGAGNNLGFIVPLSALR